MNDEINRAPLRFKCSEHRIDRAHIGHIAFEQMRSAQAFGQGQHPLFQRVALIAERQLGTMFA